MPPLFLTQTQIFMSVNAAAAVKSCRMWRQSMQTKQMAPSSVKALIWVSEVDSNCVNCASVISPGMFDATTTAHMPLDR